MLHQEHYTVVVIRVWVESKPRRANGTVAGRGRAVWRVRKPLSATLVAEEG